MKAKPILISCLVLMSLMSTAMVTASTTYSAPFFAGAQCWWGGPIFLWEAPELMDNYEFNQADVFVWAVYEGDNGRIYSLPHHYKEIIPGFPGQYYMAFYNDTMPLADGTYTVTWGYVSTPDVPYLLLAWTNSQFVYNCGDLHEVHLPLIRRR